MKGEIEKLADEDKRPRDSGLGKLPGHLQMDPVQNAPTSSLDRSVLLPNICERTEWME